MTEPVFLIDADLIALGRALKALYPNTIHVVGDRGAPSTSANDPSLYRWCREHDAILVTADFNMLRDQAVLNQLLRHVGLRVLWLRQIRGQRAQRELERIIGRWSHIRQRLMAEPTVMGSVLAGNGRLTGYRTIGDAVVEVLSSRRRGRRANDDTIASS